MTEAMETAMNYDEELRLASDPNVLKESIEALSLHPSALVRAAVALNEHASEKSLLHLVGDDNAQVLRNLGQNRKHFSYTNFSVATCKHIHLRLAEIEDSQFILSLRSNPQLNTYVSSVSDDLEAQKRWMQKYKEKEGRRQEFYFIIESRQGIPYGTVRVYDFKAGSFCWGSWMIHKDSPTYASIESALSVYQFAFYTLNFRQSHFEVNKENQKVIKFHENFGARKISSDSKNHYYDFSLADYENTKIRYKKFLA